MTFKEPTICPQNNSIFQIALFYLLETFKKMILSKTTPQNCESTIENESLTKQLEIENESLKKQLENVKNLLEFSEGNVSSKLVEITRQENRIKQLEIQLEEYNKFKRDYSNMAETLFQYQSNIKSLEEKVESLEEQVVIQSSHLSYLENIPFMNCHANQDQELE